MANKQPNLAAEKKSAGRATKKVAGGKAEVKGCSDAFEHRQRLRKQRKLDSQKKLLIGVSILASIKRGEWTEADLLAVVDRGLTRSDEKGSVWPATAAGRCSRPRGRPAGLVAFSFFMQGGQLAACVLHALRALLIGLLLLVLVLVAGNIIESI